MKNIVITGANGQLGDAFIRHLLSNRGYKIYALDLNFTNSNSSGFLGFTLIFPSIVITSFKTFVNSN